MINVAGPDGSSFAFPDGTGEDVITGALQKHYAGGEGEPAASPAEAPSPAFGTDAYVSHIATKHGAHPDYVKGLLESQLKGQALKGIPIAGAAVDPVGAAAAAAAHPLTGAGVPGESFSERYSKNKALEEEIGKDFEKENPIASTAANIAGGTVALGGAGLTSVGARLLGLTGKTLPQFVTRGALSGGAIGGADVLARGGTPEDIKTGAEIAAATGAALPVVGRGIGKAIETIRSFRQPPIAPANEVTIAGVKVPRTYGEATGDFDAIRMERGAARGATTNPEQRIAQEFFDERQMKLDEVRDEIARGMTPVRAANMEAAPGGGQRLKILADTPQEAGEGLSQEINRRATAAAKARTEAYNVARALPGEFHPRTFNGVGSDIKENLFNRPNPVAIDEQNTPNAARALKDIERNIGTERFQNLAKPPQDMEGLMARFDRMRQAGMSPANAKAAIPEFAQVPPVTMETVDNARKRILSFYRDAQAKARSNGDFSDVRATRAVIDALDNHTEDAIAKGLLFGPDVSGPTYLGTKAVSKDAVNAFQQQNALEAFQKARALHSEYRKLYTAQPNDKSSRIIENIIGKGANEPLTATDIISKAFSAQGLRGSADQVGLANRFKEILGGRTDKKGNVLSPKFGKGAQTWAQAKQGLFRLITEGTTAEKNFGDQQMVNRLQEFLHGNGKQLAKAYFGDDSVWSNKLRQVAPGKWEGGWKNGTLGLMEEMLQLHKQLIPPPGAVNYSNTAPMLMRLFRNAVDGVVGIGSLAHFGPLGIGLTYGSHKLTGAMQDVMKKSAIARSLYGTPQGVAAQQQLAHTLLKLTSLVGRSAAEPAIAAQ